MKLYDRCIDKITGKKVTIIYMSDDTIGDPVILIEPLDFSFEPEERKVTDLEIINEE